MRLTLKLVLVSVLCGPLAALASAQPQSRSMEKSELQQQMTLISSAISRVATDAVDPDRSEQALDGIEELQRGLMEAKLATPPRFGDLTEQEQHAHDRSFRKAIAGLMIEIATLEIAVLDASVEDARDSLDRIAALKKDGHEAFQEPREHRERPRAVLHDALELSPEQLQPYVGFYEIMGIRFRMGVALRDGALYLDTFGQPSERLFTAREHIFQIEVMAGVDVEFELDEQGRAVAILLHTGQGPEPQRIERVY